MLLGVRLIVILLPLKATNNQYRTIAYACQLARLNGQV